MIAATSNLLLLGVANRHAWVLKWHKEGGVGNNARAFAGGATLIFETELLGINGEMAEA